MRISTNFYVRTCPIEQSQLPEARKPFQVKRSHAGNVDPIATKLIMRESSDSGCCALLLKKFRHKMWTHSMRPSISLSLSVLLCRNNHNYEIRTKYFAVTFLPANAIASPSTPMCVCVCARGTDIHLQSRWMIAWKVKSGFCSRSVTYTDWSRRTHVDNLWVAKDSWTLLL